MKTVEVDSLIPYARNTRTHSAEQVAKIAASITEFGWTNPILIDGLGIMAGHGRILAAKSLGITEVPAIDLSHLTPAQKKAYIIADNKLALESGWDDDMLALELADLQLDGFDMGLMGFSIGELSSLFDGLDENKTGLTDQDALPEPPIIPVSKPGYVWLLGKHRLMCGDSTSTNAIDKLMNGQLADIVITDPPYGVSIVNTAVKNEVGGGGAVKFGKVGGNGNVGTLRKNGTHCIYKSKNYREIIGDETIETARAFYAACVDIGFKDFIIFGGNYFTEFLKPSPCWIVWDKQNSGNFADVEMAWCSFEKAAKLYTFTWNGMSRQGDRKTELSTRIHPTQKPVGLFVKIFDDFSFESCFDGFIGSGSTLIACEKTNKICYGMELTTDYCDATVIRWQNFTGQQATLEATGQTFNQLLEQTEVIPA
ncbi:MAG: DNA methyltransferase [Methylobacter sp.]